MEDAIPTIIYSAKVLVNTTGIGASLGTWPSTENCILTKYLNTVSCAPFHSKSEMLDNLRALDGLYINILFSVPSMYTKLHVRNYTMGIKGFIIATWSSNTTNRNNYHTNNT